MNVAQMFEAQLIDLHPPAEAIEQEVLAGLQQQPKALSPKLLYDHRGSELFEGS